jgi:hypothetical protein
MERTVHRMVLLMMVGLLGLSGCSGAAPEVAAATPATSSATVSPSTTTPPRAAIPADVTTELRDEILRLVGTASCREDSQCRSLPMGSKPCGGPEGYLAWSTAATDARQLEALAARYKEARQARNQRSGLMSDCAVVAEPAVRCVATSDGSGGRCEAVRGRGALSPAVR